jgi:hypothetical protein
MMLVCGLIGWGYQIYVVRKLKSGGYTSGRVIGRFSFLVPLVQGWKYAKELEISDIMIFWSIFLGLTILSGIVFLLSFLMVQ